jgi:hypothetical protein
LEEDYRGLLDQYPFLSYLTYGGNDYLGIVQNHDDVITTIYDYGLLTTRDEKLLFLELAESWWWESNRLIPINVFLKQDWMIFRGVLKTFNSKDVRIRYGPYLSLKELSQKKTKRKVVTLVRKVQ